MQLRFKRNSILQGVRPISFGFTVGSRAVLVHIQLLIFMMLVKSRKFYSWISFSGTKVWNSLRIQVVSSWLRRYDATHSTKIRFQLRIVVDVAQCCFPLFLYHTINSEKFSGFIKYKAIFSGNGNLPYFNGTSVVFFIWNSFKCFIL
jgi:hypothetical protein